MQKTKPKPAKGTFERMARIPRNQLLDQIFNLYRDQARWPIRALRERTQQPEVYLKEVLSEVAFLHRSGEHNGLWELKESYKGDGVCFVLYFLHVRGVKLKKNGFLKDEGRKCCQAN